jgi:hypothetical protein
LRVIPILVDEAEMPASRDVPVELHALLTRNAVRVRHDTFKSDVARLAYELRA